MTREKTNEVEDEDSPQTDTLYVWKLHRRKHLLFLFFCLVAERQVLFLSYTHINRDIQSADVHLRKVMPPLLQHDAKVVMTHTSAARHPHPSHPLPTPPTVRVLFICQLHTGTALPTHWRLYPICQGWHTHGSRYLPLSSATHAPSLPHHAALRLPRLCQWALRYLMAGPTCRRGDFQTCPICRSNPAGTSWLDSLHADRWTIVDWMITHIHNSQGRWLTDLNRHRHSIVSASAADWCYDNWTRKLEVRWQVLDEYKSWICASVH